MLRSGTCTCIVKFCQLYMYMCRYFRSCFDCTVCHNVIHYNYMYILYDCEIDHKATHMYRYMYIYMHVNC